jgi:hypothetical protein
MATAIIAPARPAAGTFADYELDAIDALWLARVCNALAFRRCDDIALYASGWAAVDPARAAGDVAVLTEKTTALVACNQWRAHAWHVRALAQCLRVKASDRATPKDGLNAMATEFQRSSDALAIAMGGVLTLD